MVRFKEFLAFPMFATAIWLVYVLDRQVGASGIAVALCIGLGFVFLTWLLTLLGPRLRWIVGVPGLALLAASCLQIRAATSAGRRRLGAMVQRSCISCARGSQAGTRRFLRGLVRDLHRQ